MFECHGKRRDKLLKIIFAVKYFLYVIVIFSVDKLSENANNKQSERIDLLMQSLNTRASDIAELENKYGLFILKHLDGFSKYINSDKKIFCHLFCSHLFFTIFELL